MRAAGTEVHAYALGHRKGNDIRIEHFVSAGTPRASAAMIEPDFSESAKAVTPYLQAGLSLLGEAHSHLSLVGASTGDLHTLASISDQYPSYLCIVIAPGKPDQVITAHTVEGGAALAHTVIIEEYKLLDPRTTGALDMLFLGWGSGGAAATPSIFKLGFRTITAADTDVVEPRNIERHLAATSDVGKPKVDVFKRFARGRTSSRTSSRDL